MDGKKSLDVYIWLNKVTLDIIGLAGDFLSLLPALITHSESHVGFNYAFDSLNPPAEEKRTKDMYWAIRSVMALAVLPSPFFAIQLFFPMFRLFVSISLYLKGLEYKRTTESPTILQSTRLSRALSRAFKEIQRAGSQLIQERKAAVRAECDANGSGVVGRQDVGGHDPLSLLIKANIAADMPESMRMSDSEILSREHIVPFPNLAFRLGVTMMTYILEVPAFLLAGHETSR